MVSGIGCSRCPAIVPATLSTPNSGTNLSADRSVSGTLSVVTRDGDTFTLSAERDASLTYTNTGGQWSASASTHQSLSVTMQGDFDARELHDIARAVRRFLRDLRAQFRGQEGSLANVATMPARTLASVSATSTSDFHTAFAAPQA